MTGETAREISTNSEVLKRLAEVPHAAMFSQYHPRGSACRDYSGIADRRLHRRGRPVAYGEIPWLNLSRLNDEEMKALMIDVVNKTYHAVIVLFDDRLGGELIKILAQRDFLPDWNEPTLTTTG